MITSAAEFLQLRTSEDPSEYRRAAHEDAPESVWVEIVRDLPEMRGAQQDGTSVDPSDSLARF